MWRGKAFDSKYVVSALALAAVLTPGAAMAQDSERGKVETVVVTAERRSENLQKAPVAAMVLTQEDLNAHDIHGVDDLEFSTPSLTVGSNGQSTQINIRGIGKEDNSGNATSAVAIYRDGIGVISGFATNEPYYDVNTVEVLRGPQGTFSGENAAGGAIFINTRDPDPSAGYTGYAEVGYANYDEKDAQGAINVPIDDNLAARISFDHVDRNSFYHVWMDPAMTIPNPGHVGSRDYNSARLGLLWQPTSHVEMKLKLDYNDLDNHGYAFTVVEGFPVPFPTIANISSDPFVVGNNSTDNYAKDTSARGALDIKITLPDGLLLRSLSGAQWLHTYIRNDDDGSAFVDRRQHINATFKIYSEELTLSSPDTDRFNWIVGAFEKRETLDFPTNDGFVLSDATDYIPGTLVPEIVFVWHTPRQTQAVFGKATYNITDRLKVELGLRYQHFITTEIADLSILPTILGIVLPTYYGGFDGRGPGKDGYNEDALTGKLAVNYQLDDDNFLYAFVATGSTTGGVNVVIGLPNYKNQKTTDIEAGWKSQLFEDHLFTQIGGYYDLIDDYQAFFANAGVPGGGFLNLDGLSKVYGLEASAQAVFDDLALDASIGVMHSSLGHAIILSGGLDFDTQGKRQPFSPDLTVHFGAQYAFHLENGATLTPRADVAYTSEQTLTPIDASFPTPSGGTVFVDRTPAHTLLNAKLTYDTEKWSAEAYVTNLTDEAYIEAHGGPGYNAYVNEPRRFGIRLHYNIGD
jgi:iron complex outermembrane receptor protein